MARNPWTLLREQSQVNLSFLLNDSLGLILNDNTAVWAAIEVGLSGVNSDQWPDHFAGADNYLRLALVCARCRSLEIPYNFSTALFEIAQRIANGTLSIADRRADWDAVLQATNAGAKRQLLVRAMDWLLETRRSDLQIRGMLSLLGPGLAALLQSSPDKVVYNVLIPLIEENNAIGVELIRSNRELFSHCASLAAPDAIDSLRYHLANRLTGEADQRAVWREISDAVGVVLTDIVANDVTNPEANES